MDGTMDRSEMLAGPHWGSGLAELITTLPQATVADEVALLRKGYGAITEVAATTPALFDALPSTARFETLLACGALESATFALIPHSAGYMLSRGGNGCHIGSVFLAECGEHTVQANTPALAMMAAILSACQSLLHPQKARTELLN
jgi:hypothetical protein